MNADIHTLKKKKKSHSLHHYKTYVLNKKNVRVNKKNKRVNKNFSALKK